MIRSWFKKTGYVKLIRILLGIILVVQGIVTHDFFMMGLGGVLTFLSFLLPECSCFTSSCDAGISSSRKTHAGKDTIHFEEVTMSKK